MRRREEKAEGLSNQGGNCANCGKPTDLANSDAHHVQRHADGGGDTKSENMAVVCKDCHKELHGADK
ncbi:HNH endonuclease [Stenotrophomonas sp. PUT21]|uniref:HNH endonuclease n=1 Tax=Stenotrophomonas TaxID=40323 RepID=UPI003BA133BE